MKKKSSHFSVEDIIRSEFKNPVSRGTIGKDANGLLWAYGVVLKDSRYNVGVITIDVGDILDCPKKDNIGTGVV